MIYVGSAGIPIQCKGSNTLQSLACIKKLKLDAMEVQFSRNFYLNEKGCDAIKEENKKYGIRLSIHAPYYINLASQKKETVKQSIADIMHSLHLAEHMGANIIVFHPGYYSGRDEKEAYSMVKDALQNISKGFKGKVKIGIETMGRQKTFGTIDEIAKICKEVKNVVPVIDFAHIHARTNGSLRREEDFDKIFLHFKKSLGINEFHCHITGVEFNKGNEGYHLTLEHKKPDFKLLANLLRKRKYNATIISESPILDYDAMLFKKWLSG